MSADLALIHPTKDDVNPTPLPKIFDRDDPDLYEQVEEHRNLSCEFYDSCLDMAVRKKWKNFSCKECKWNQIRPTKEK